jgi:hypothetical protein
MQYSEVYRRSISDPEAFWAELADDIPWFVAPQSTLSNDANGVARWFADGTLNTCYCALDYHVQQGRGDQTALIYDSPVTNTVTRYRYAELTDWTARVAGGLVELGVSKGDVVIIYMPDGAGDGGCNVGVRANWRGALGCVRWFCRRRTCHAH